MGSSDNGAGVVDCSVGSIVWVRRRNGSWWPGKILGPEELSAAHLMSPRSGTPVKLLGREDASVDWYNLEKSKRVKAFRCGEFDDCIERAESSLGMPPKKREKYARREDAILHALELEKQLLEKNGELGRAFDGKTRKSSDAVEKELVAPLEALGNGNGKPVHPKSNPEMVDSLFEDKSRDHPPNGQKVKEGSQRTGDDNNSEVIPRMRGLQDFGLRIAPSKRKISSSVALDVARNPESDNIACALPSDLGTENTVDNSSKSFSEKRKNSHEMLTEDSLFKRRDRRRPLVQVLQSSAKLPDHDSLQRDNDNVSILTAGEEQTGVMHHEKRIKCVDLPGKSSDCIGDEQFSHNQLPISPSHRGGSSSPHPAALVEENTSRSTENTETDSSETDSLGLDADEEMMAVSDAAAVVELEPKYPGSSGAQIQHGSMNSEDLNDSAKVGVSKWQLKGKRNHRGFAKRSIAVTGRRIPRGSVYGTNFEDTENNDFDELDLIEKNLRTRRGVFDNRGCLLTSKPASKGLDDVTQDMYDWDDLAWNDHSVLKGRWEESNNCYDPVFAGHRNFGGRMKSMLLDVDLKVQSSYQREHVPMISLMSKLNGQAIVGHPIQIEALESGSSDILLSEADGTYPNTLDNDKALNPMWTTARRTANSRVPRLHPSATLDGEETADQYQYANQDKKVQFKKSNLGNLSYKPSVMRKSQSRASRPPLDRKFSRKPQKKISLSSSQKIKTLSSIGAEKNIGNDLKLGTNNYQLGGMIKGESGPTAVACIPVKLVFSRLYEELVGRHQ